jgi:acyl phosphate:glycerol-3-phosphate acyltransferase
MTQLSPLLLIVGAYLVGSIPFSFLVTKFVSGEDIREHGSRNVGATNVLRTQGKLPGLFALVLDLAKGWCAIWLARALVGGAAWPWPIDGSAGVLSSEGFWLGLTALVVVLAHMYPAWLGFHGGKGVATSAGVFLGLNAGVLGIAVVVFLVIAVSTRYVSLGSTSAAVVIPPLMRFWADEPFWLVVASVAISLLVLVKHQTNIARIIQGSESKLR